MGLNMGLNGADMNLTCKSLKIRSLKITMSYPLNLKYRLSVRVEETNHPSLRSGCFVCKICLENLWSNKFTKLSCEVIVSKKNILK